MQKSSYLIQAITLSMLLLCNNLFAQKEDVKIKALPVPDSVYIRSYADNLNMTLIYSTHNLRYRTFDADNAEYVFSPNEIYETEIDATYSFINVRYSFSPPFLDINNNENIKGKTERNDFDIGLSINRFDVRFEDCDVKGFYLHNTSDFDPSWKPGKPYTLFPGLQVKQTGGQITYNTNTHFSLASLDCGDEQQLKTAYSFLPSLYLYHFKIKDGDTAIKRGEDEYSKNWDINIYIPAAVNVVFAKNWHCSAVAGPGIGLDIISSTLINKAFKPESEKQTLLSVGYTARLSLGWSNRRFYAGIDGGLRDYAHVQNGNDNMEKLFYNASIYGGMRFNAPGFLKHSIDWVKKILPVDL